MRARRAAPALLAAGAALILLFSLVGGPAGSVGFAVVAVAYPFALMAFGAARRVRRGTSSGGWGAALPIALLALMVELSLAGMLVLRGRGLDGPWLAGLPLAAALQIYGVFLLPLAVNALGFALTFGRFAVAAEDLERLRELAPEDPSGSGTG